MRKKHIISLTLLYLCLAGCSVRKSKTTNIQEEVSFIIDTTLQQEYVDVKPFEGCDTISTNKIIVSVEDVFEKVKPCINSLVKEGIIEIQGPLHIHLINDSIWIVRSKPVSKTNELFFGGTVYYEIRKNDGFVLKRIIEE